MSAAEAHIKVPTKITLFGEHAVVYGIPAIATTIPVHIDMIGRRTSSDYIRINIKQGLMFLIRNVEINKDLISVEPDPMHSKRLLSYILTALSVCEEELQIRNRKGGYVIVVDSPLPSGIGLGTSAAISVGTITLCMILNGYIKNEEVNIHRTEIAKLAWNVEKIVQGSASPMDTHTIALGGLRYIDPSRLEAQLINIDYDLPILVGYTTRRNTTADLIKMVKKIKERNEKLFFELLNIVKDIVEEAKKALFNRDLEMLGMLMNVNHGILQSLGVVNNDHNIIAQALRNAGALGFKTSGAGGGGAFVALATSRETQEKLSILAESLGAKIVSKEICFNGVSLVNDYRRPS
uniref:Mevalonate kinase n=1 Tax=Ignisphaera aggregans TaxID=334771 RepID=A0A7C2V8Y2_9CREN